MFSKSKKLLCTIAAAAVLTTGTIGANNAQKSDLRQLISSDKLEATAYTPITYQEYEECLAKAVDISDELFTASDEIDEAYANLQSSIEQLQPLPDKSNLQNAYNHAANIDQSLYIPMSVEALQNALSVALDTLNNPNSTLDEVDQAVVLLDSGETALILKPDKTELRALLKTVAETDEDLYLPSSYLAVDAAMKHANTVLFNENALESDVKNAISELQTAADNLVRKPDKTALQELIAQASTTPVEKYTTASFTVLQKNINSTTNILNDNNATQEQVDSAKASLQNALDELIESTKGIYEINIWFSRESNNHVGNSWSYGASYNDARIDGETITVSHGTTISIFCKVVEEDSIPDVGSGYLSLRMEDGAENTLTISVYENRGRYSGNRAVWVVTATATLIERV